MAYSRKSQARHIGAGSRHPPLREINNQRLARPGASGSTAPSVLDQGDTLAAWKAIKAAAAAYRRLIATISTLNWAAVRRPEYCTLSPALGGSEAEKIAALQRIIRAQGPLSKYQRQVGELLDWLERNFEDLRLFETGPTTVEKAASGEAIFYFREHSISEGVTIDRCTLGATDVRVRADQARISLERAANVLDEVGRAFEAQ